MNRNRRVEGLFQGEDQVSLGVKETSYNYMLGSDDRVYPEFDYELDFSSQFARSAAGVGADVVTDRNGILEFKDKKRAKKAVPILTEAAPKGVTAVPQAIMDIFG